MRIIFHLIAASALLLSAASANAEQFCALATGQYYSSRNSSGNWFPDEDSQRTASG